MRDPETNAEYQAWRRNQARRWRPRGCGGPGAYAGPCGAPDCPTCHPEWQWRCPECGWRGYTEDDCCPECGEEG